MPSAGVRGLAVAEIAAGLAIAWSGVENVPITDTLRALATGKIPKPGPGEATASATATSSGSGSPFAQAVGGPPPSTATIAGYKAYAQVLIAAHGWGLQFSSFNSIVEAESGWNNQARNPSGAYGIAQALGHGNANTAAPDGTNAYGGYGTIDTVCKLANEGSGGAQIEWMCNYIAMAYGTADNAWAFHQAHGYY